MDAHEISQEVLTDIERRKVISFNQDPLMVEAVKKYILAVLYRQGTVEKGKPHNARINWALNLAWGATDGRGMPRTDEELGQNLRAMTSAVQMLESGFKELSEIREVSEAEETKVNQGE